MHKGRQLFCTSRNKKLTKLKKASRIVLVPMIDSVGSFAQKTHPFIYFFTAETFLDFATNITLSVPACYEFIDSILHEKTPIKNEVDEVLNALRAGPAAT